MFKEDSERWFGKFAFKTCYFSRRKGAKSWNGMWRPTSVWFSLIGSMVTHGCTWFAPSKSPKSRESHAMYFSQIERPFSFHFFGVFINLFLKSWMLGEAILRIPTKFVSFQVRSCRFLVVGISWIYWSKVFQVATNRETIETWKHGKPMVCQKMEFFM